ncbi:MAG TPA: hypothetical protein VHQ92_18540 [Pseudolabrys sp.]|jgi:hypothetical protein|nr:hypothetical protein [Pseudolabrys sp.]
MKKISALALAGLLAGFAAPAAAQMRDQGVYEMVTTHQYENASFGTSTARHGDPHVRGADKVIILDKRNGALWAWSEPQQTVMYLGQIFPLTSSGVFARIIQVEPEQKR